MTEFEISAETRRAEAAVSKGFRERGWSVSETKRSHQPVIEVSKDRITFYVKCVDTTLQKFFGVSNILDRLERFSRDYRVKTGGIIVYVLAQPLIGLNPETLPARGIALFLLHEVPALAGIDEALSISFSSMDERTKTVAAGCCAFCVAASGKAVERGDLDEAQKWLELSIEGINVVTEARYKLVDLYLKTGNTDAAKEVAQKGLAFSPYNLVLLAKLKAIEAAAGNLAGVQELDEKIAAASIARPTLQTILSRQKKVDVGSGQSNRFSADKTGFLARLLVRFRE